MMKEYTVSITYQSIICRKKFIKNSTLQVWYELGDNSNDNVNYNHESDDKISISDDNSVDDDDDGSGVYGDSFVDKDFDYMKHLVLHIIHPFRVMQLFFY